MSPTAVQAWVRRQQQGDEDRVPRPAWLNIRPIDRETQERVDTAWTPHDLRRTFSVRLHEALKVAPHVVEALLNHRAQGMAAIYNRSELFPERAEMGGGTRPNRFEVTAPAGPRSTQEDRNTIAGTSGPGRRFDIFTPSRSGPPDPTKGASARHISTMNGRKGSSGQFCRDRKRG